MQRRLSNEIQFKVLDTVASKAPGMVTAGSVYNRTDSNDWQGISFYRLVLVDK